MLSKLVILPNDSQRLVLIIDELGQEHIAQQFCLRLLREQGLESAVKQLPVNGALRESSTFNSFIKECSLQPPQNSNVPNNNNTSDIYCDKSWSVVLPTLADLLCYQSPAVIFQFLRELKRCPYVRLTMLWACPQFLENPTFMIAACEYMADVVLHMRSTTELSIVTRKRTGGVSKKKYSYKTEQNQLLVQEIKNAMRSSPDQSHSVSANETTKPEQQGTFKIELEEDEMVARNALKLPYEKTSTNISDGGRIIYTPDAADDFDDEDPDEDLCI